MTIEERSLHQFYVHLLSVIDLTSRPGSPSSARKVSSVSSGHGPSQKQSTLLPLDQLLSCKTDAA
jgi:hypothetical protein